MRKIFRKPYRVKRKKSRISSRFFWLSILILIILGGIFYFLIFSDFFQLEKITISGEKKTSKTDISLLIEKEVERKILFFPTKSIFLVNLNELKEKILNSFPQIGEIEIKKIFPDGLNLVVKEREGAAIFCQNNLCFLVDKEGIIFENTFTEGELLKIKKAAEDKELKIGAQILEKEFLQSILKIKSKLEEDLKIPSEEVLVISNDRINIKTTEGWEIYLNPKGDVDWQLTKLRVDLEEEIPQERRKDLEYIELRFGNFAPYKYR